MSTKIVRNQIPLPVVRQMSSINHFQSAIFGAAWIQSVQNPCNAIDVRVCGSGHRIIDPLTSRSIGHEGLSPAIKGMSPGVDPTSRKNVQLHRLGTKPPDAAGIQSSDAERCLNVTVDINRLVHIELAIHAPAKRVEDMMCVFRSEAAQHDARLIRLAVSISVAQVQHFGAVGDVGPPVSRFDRSRDQQAVGENGCFVRDPVSIDVFQDQDLVSRFLSRRNLRIDLGRCNPQPPLGVEVHLDRFMNSGVGREQVHFESLGQDERLPFFFRIGNGDILEFSLCKDSCAG